MYLPSDTYLKSLFNSLQVILFVLYCEQLYQCLIVIVINQIMLINTYKYQV